MLPDKSHRRFARRIPICSLQSNMISDIFINQRESSHPNSVFKLAPKLVVKAIKPHLANLRFELSFQKDDYFFVIDQRARYYEVINPVQKLRGLVPIDCFEEIKSSPLGYEQVPVLKYHPLSPATTVESSDCEESGPALVMQTLKRNDCFSLFESVCFVDVPDVQLSNIEKKWVFSISLRFHDGTQRLLFRGYEEFFNLQILILLNFNLEAGYDLEPRIIPFLPSPQPLDANEIQKRKKYLSYYLDQLLFGCPQRIVDSDKLDSFFCPREGDIVTNMPLVFDSSSVLLDLIDSFKIIDNPVTIRLILGQDIQQFRVLSSISYYQLRNEIQDRLEFSFEELLFKDEAEQMIVIYGDDDLKMLLKMEVVSVYVS